MTAIIRSSVTKAVSYTHLACNVLRKIFQGFLSSSTVIFRIKLDTDISFLHLIGDSVRKILKRIKKMCIRDRNKTFLILKYILLNFVKLLYYLFFIIIYLHVLLCYRISKTTFMFLNNLIKTVF